MSKRSLDTLTLRELRRSAGISGKEMADRLGISQNSLLFRERRENLRLSSLQEYLSALGCDLVLVARATGSLGLGRAVIVELGVDEAENKQEGEKMKTRRGRRTRTNAEE